ncbi:MAG: nitrilase-related carbon-nitrogen hydrolase, partial [Chloroflexota bacterium]
MFRVAAIQLSSGEDKKSNIERAVKLSEEAAGEGAQLIALPETFDYRGDSEKVSSIAEVLPGPAIRPLM